MSASHPAPRVEPLGDSALRIVLGDTLDADVNRRACALADRIAQAMAGGHLPGVHDVLPAFAAVGVHYHVEAVHTQEGRSPFATLAQQLAPLLADLPDEPAASGRLVEIPVCYGGEHGPDLQEVAAASGLTPQALIDLHQHPRDEQRVYMIGFAPGFPYVGRLDAAFALPRRPTPRTSMPWGTVCIANRQSVVYSVTAPGGWNMIGRTPLRLFDPARSEPCLLRPGDRIRFRAIDEAAFAAALQANGTGAQA